MCSPTVIAFGTNSLEFWTFSKIFLFLDSIFQHYLKLVFFRSYTYFWIIWVKSKTLNTSSRPMFITVTTNYHTTDNNITEWEKSVKPATHMQADTPADTVRRHCRATILTSDIDERQCWPVCRGIQPTLSAINVGRQKWHSIRPNSVSRQRWPTLQLGADTIVC